jgi:hydroxymethylbilane synthase
MLSSMMEGARQRGSVERSAANVFYPPSPPQPSFTSSTSSTTNSFYSSSSPTSSFYRGARARARDTSTSTTTPTTPPTYNNNNNNNNNHTTAAATSPFSLNYPKPLDAFIRHSPFNSSPQVRAHMDVHQTLPVVRIGTRSSALARRQSSWVAVELLRWSDDGATAEEVPVLTAGDRDKTSAMSTMDKGMWTTDLENMLLGNEIDLVVHSLKDLATTMPEGCALGAITKREDPRDVLVVRQNLLDKPEYAALSTMPLGSVIGTSSVRRAAQMRRLYPHLEFLDVRGNIDTRLRKLDERESRYSALVLAAAGLLRMGFGDRITQYLDKDNGGIMHAVGQGALGVQVRIGDEATQTRVRRIEDRDASLACTAERAVMRVLEGGCSVPIGVETKWVAEEDAKKLRFRTIVISLDGSEAVEHEIVEVVESKEDAEALGKKMAAALVEQGASKILDAIKAERRQA